MAMIQALPPGTHIGHFKLLKALGQGGFGITYVAWDSQLERTVVLKECFPVELCCRQEDGSLAPRSESLEPLYRAAMDDMRREARTLAGLHHERIVPVYDVFESQGSLFFVMPWLEGGSLLDRMDEAAIAGVRIDPATAQRWLMMLLEGLGYMHDKKILHRDIKPSNIMFDERGDPVLIDFGAAVSCATTTLTQGAFSPGYAAPEQITGKGKMGPPTDLFALASTWYELLSGEAPEPVVSRLMADELVPLAKLPGMENLPPHLSESIMRNLALLPEQRCATAEQWYRWLADEIPAPRQTRRQRRTSRTRMQIIALGLLITGLGVLLRWLLSEEEEGGLSGGYILPASSNGSFSNAGKSDLDSLFRAHWNRYGYDELIKERSDIARRFEEVSDRYRRQASDLRRNLLLVQGSRSEREAALRRATERFFVLCTEYSKEILPLNDRLVRSASRLKELNKIPMNQALSGTPEEFNQAQMLQMRLEEATRSSLRLQPRYYTLDDRPSEADIARDSDL